MYSISFFGVAFWSASRGRLDSRRGSSKVASWSSPMPWIAIESGWFVAEYGRQPWVIEGVSPTYYAASGSTIADPVAGVAYSSQDKANMPVEPRIAGDGPIDFDVPVTSSDDGRPTGPLVRRAGPMRRVVYIATGTSAGQHASVWSRRAKIDVHDIPADSSAQARSGRVSEIRSPGRARDDGPACATVRPSTPWRAA
ncbi:hypothetical protein OY671_009389 [Metschnikowia pulcherrima]|nr:hypothetical protein OY671_009389 [Metschnikowia pulcherrima]